MCTRLHSPLLWLLVLFAAIRPQDANAFFNPGHMFVKNFSVAQGLSQSVVTDMTLDKQGFVWIGTHDGLNRFDGSSFAVYRHQPGDSNSLPASHILRLLADRDDRLWIQTSMGAALFDCSTGRTLHPSFLKAMKNPFFCRNDLKSIWVYDRQEGLGLVQTSELQIQRFRPDKNILADSLHILDMFCTQQDVYILATNGNMIVFNSTTHQFRQINCPLALHATYDCCGTDKKGIILWGGLHAGLIGFNPSTQQYETPACLQDARVNDIRSIQFDATNNVMLLGTDGHGLVVYDYTRNLLDSYTKEQGSFHPHSNHILHSLSDNNGVIYLGYDGEGFDVLNPYIRKFETLNLPADQPDLQAILEDRHGRLWLGGNQLICYDRAQQQASLVALPATTTRREITAMQQTGDRCLVTYTNGSLDILDETTLQLKSHLTSDLLHLNAGTYFTTIQADQQGQLWLGTNAGTLYTMQVSGQPTPVRGDALPASVRCIHAMPDARLLLGTNQGLFVWNTHQNQIEKTICGESRLPLLAVNTLWQDYKKRWWIGSEGQGLWVLDDQFHLLKNFHTGNGLANNVIHGLIPEKDTIYWISSNAGLTRISWNEQSLQAGGKLHSFTYDENNGLQSNEFSTSVCLRLQDGRFAFGGRRGINIFRAEDIQNNHVVPQVYINQFKVYEKELPLDTLLPYLFTINLKPDENSFAISCGTIGMCLPGKTRFRYRLIGNDKDWIDGDTRNYISYTNLKPGEYEFQVKASNYDGIWNENFTRMRIIIATPFYKSWWFIVLWTGFLLQAAYLFIRYRIRLRKEKEETRVRHTRELAEVEMKALRAQINPHFLFNSLNSINSYILRHDNKLASRYLVKFSQLVRKILSNSFHPLVTLQEELSTIELYLQIEGMRFSDQFTYQIEVDPLVDTSRQMIPSLLLQPYVENAIWHGLLHKEGEKRIHIRIRPYAQGSICIEIDDNGIGRQQAAAVEEKQQAHKSFGMQIGEKRLQLLHEEGSAWARVLVIDKYDEQKNPCGTTIEIILPGNIFMPVKSDPA